MLTPAESTLPEEYHADRGDGDLFPDEFTAPANVEPMSALATPAPEERREETYPIPAGAGAPDWMGDKFTISFEDCWLHELWEERVVEGNNDLIGCVAASAKSAGSGVGKTTLALQLARALDASGGGFDASDKATLSATKFSRGLLNDPDTVEDKSAIIFEEATGTLDDQGADARRSMAGAVMDVTKALATLRYRQCSALLVAQNIGWLDKRLRDVLDFLVLIQEPGRAVVFHPYGNDFSSAQYNERKCDLVWQPLPAGGNNDGDYLALERMKRESTKDEVEEKAVQLDREQKVLVGARLRQRGVNVADVAEAVGMSEGWVSTNCSDVDPAAL
jgi:hypothetical protein